MCSCILSISDNNNIFDMLYLRCRSKGTGELCRYMIILYCHKILYRRFGLLQSDIGCLKGCKFIFIQLPSNASTVYIAELYSDSPEGTTAEVVIAVVP